MSMELFITGIVLGIALVYVIVNHLSFAVEPTEREIDIVEVPEEITTIHIMTVEEMDAWYNSMMEIFSVKE